MAEWYPRNFSPLASEVRFTRQRVAAMTLRSFQRNVQHLYGIRLNPLVEDWEVTGATGGAFLRMPAAFGSTPEYLVTVSRGVTRLYGAVVWTCEQWLADGTDVEAQFYSERADDGAGVAVLAGTDPVTAATLTDNGFRGDLMPGQDPPWRRDLPAEPPMPQNLVIEGSTASVQYTPRVLGGEAGMLVADWAPNLATSHDQRVQCRTRATSNANNAILLAVYVWEGIPIG